jgi:glycine/D-amino acid oxidase-like deaminating enzyme
MEPYLNALTETRYCPLWHDRNPRPESCPPLSGDESCELLIVGGGFTGLWAALQARERMPDLDIVLLESTFVGDGASGRNGGIVARTLTHGEHNADDHFSGEAERIDELGKVNFRELVESLQRYSIDAEFEEAGYMDVATRAYQVKSFRESYETKMKKGLNVTWYDRDEIQRQIHSPTYHAGVFFPDRGGVLDPARLCWELKKVLLDSGVRIFEGTPMLGLEPDGLGMRTACPTGSIRSDKILMATNAFPNPLGAIRRSVIPVWDYQLATEPLSSTQRELVGWKKPYSVSDVDHMFHYYRMTRDHRITWGGGGSVCYYYGSRTDPGVADPRERFERLSQTFFHTFPHLAGIKFTHRWGGIIASSTRYCVVPGVAYDGRVSWAVGYTGLGVGASRFGARIGLELLGYQPSDILDLDFVRKKAMNWPPEPLRWFGVTMTRRGMMKADRNGGRLGPWMKLMDRLNLGFAC